MGIFDSLLNSGLGSSSTPITPENPVNATVWTSSQNAAPNPFFKAMNQQTVQDIQMVGNGNIGGVLAAKGIVSGPNGSIINATLDFFLNGGTNPQITIPSKLQNYAVTTNFIPIIFKTEFNYMTGTDPQSTKTPLYILFDSTPESIAFSKTANWTLKPILGRPEPVWTYSDSGAQTVTITGDFFVNSSDEHIYKLKVSDYLMALATPSKTNFMPSPIQVMIGEWKNFRAIVNSVSIDFNGPWKIYSGSSSTTTNTFSAAQTAANTAQNNVDRYQGTASAWATSANLVAQNALATAATQVTAANNVPQHAPYFFRATIQLTLVSKENNVQYAEDIINNAGALNSISPVDIANIQKTMQAASGISSSLTTGAFTMGQSSSGYSYTNGMLTQTTSYTVQATSNFQYGTGDSQRQSADLGIITNAVSSQLADIIKKKI
jgi:hypothetical protein